MLTIRVAQNCSVRRTGDAQFRRGIIRQQQELRELDAVATIISNGVSPLKTSHWGHTTTRKSRVFKRDVHVSTVVARSDHDATLVVTVSIAGNAAVLFCRDQNWRRGVRQPNTLRLRAAVATVVHKGVLTVIVVTSRSLFIVGIHATGHRRPAVGNIGVTVVRTGSRTVLGGTVVSSTIDGGTQNSSYW